MSRITRHFHLKAEKLAILPRNTRRLVWLVAQACGCEESPCSWPGRTACGTRRTGDAGDSAAASRTSCSGHDGLRFDDTCTRTWNACVCWAAWLKTSSHARWLHDHQLNNIINNPVLWLEFHTSNLHALALGRLTKLRRPVYTSVYRQRVGRHASNEVFRAVC
jgi:hypothetical protein